jgi:hypothetical protein
MRDIDLGCSNARTAMSAPLAALLVAGALTASAQPPTPVIIHDNERVVHLVGAPFSHVYCKPHLAKLLLARCAHRGLTYRRVPVDRLTAKGLLRDLEKKVLLHEPTLVVLQPGSSELRLQFRRPTFDFESYPAALERLVAAIRERGIRVILCSVTPMGEPSPGLDQLTPVHAGLKGWVDAARETARRHDAVFIDLFSEAVAWPMISGLKNLYGPAEHETSWQLFRQQLRLEPTSAGPAKAPLTVEDETAFEAAMDALQKATSELEEICAFRIPPWLKLEDGEAQRQAAMAGVRAALAEHDRRLREVMSHAEKAAAIGAP